MSYFNSIQTPTQLHVLLALFDVRNYTRLSKKLSSQECFNILNQLSEFAGETLESEGGRLIKFMGDSGLLIFSEENVDRGVNTLFSFQKLVRTTFKSTGFNQIDINCHFGEVCVGLFGPESNKQLDIMGTNVNTLFTMQRHQGKGSFFITPQVFRKLNNDTRKIFHKFTPPIVYIGES